MSKSDSRIFLLLGMHRSGTSLTANWLHHCGLNLGEEFIKTDVGNTEGYFEDQTFVKFHKRILCANGIQEDVHHQDVKYSEQNIALASNIIENRNSNNHQWGWKDPRTCLFLNLWNEIIPDAKVLVVFRHFDEVVDSLIRRRAKAEKKRRNFIAGYYNLLTKRKYRASSYTDELLKSWIKHNEEILKFLNTKKREDCLLINALDIPEKSEEIYQHLKRIFELKLSPFPFDKIYKERLLKTPTTKIEYSVTLRNRAEKLYADLGRFSVKSKFLNQV